jgi:chloramphenicol O-acetyltransferase
MKAEKWEMQMKIVSVFHSLDEIQQILRIQPKYSSDLKEFLNNLRNDIENMIVDVQLSNWESDDYLWECD